MYMNKHKGKKPLLGKHSLKLSFFLAVLIAILLTVLSANSGTNFQAHAANPTPTPICPPDQCTECNNTCGNCTGWDTNLNCQEIHWVQPCSPSCSITPVPTSSPVSNPPPGVCPGECPVCPQYETWDASNRVCVETAVYETVNYPPTCVPCPETSICYEGCGCNTPCNKNAQFQPGNLPCGTSGTFCSTAIGTIDASGFGGLIKTLFSILLAVGGGLAVLLIIVSGYRLIISQGNPESVQNARNQLAAAVVGLLFIIFSLVILQAIGVDIIKIPGFGP